MRGVAFKVTYNDGGAAPGGLIGYRGVCSSPVILENVKIRGMTNCARPDGPCRLFADANFKGTRPSLKGREPWCYESRLLDRKPWRFGAGIYHHGKRIGQPIPMRLASVGDVAFLTTVAPNGSEAERFIFAAYRIGRIEEIPEWGFTVISDGTMEVRVPDEVAQDIKFWKYYSNSDFSSSWKTGLFRGLSEEQTTTILAELMGALGDRDERDLIFEALDRKVNPRPPKGIAGQCGLGEGEAHRRLKERVAADPGLVGLPTTAKAKTEHAYKSGDRVDVRFDLADGRMTVVEIETIVTLPGAHQCVKYRALQEAECDEAINSGKVDAVLVAYGFDAVTREFAQRYGIRLVALPP
jgi:hypothetical protein